MTIERIPRSRYRTEKEATAIAAIVKARYEPGSFGCHEALHMTIYLAEQIEAQLCDHPAIQLKPDWKKLADEACQKLNQLYQAIGQEHL